MRSECRKVVPHLNMSLTRRALQNPGDSQHHALIHRCMAIVLVKSFVGSDTLNSRSSKDSSSSVRTGPEQSNGIAEGPGPPLGKIDKCLGPEAFLDLLKENSGCFWNPTLVQSITSLEYRGCVVPSTLLVSGTDYTLEVVRSAWSRRLLRPPCGYDISMLGDVDPVKMLLVPQTQFAPLPEALCKVVYDLNVEGRVANMAVIGSRLKTTFPEIILPEEGVLYRTLGSLIRERKLYHTGNGYSVVTPETFRLLAMSPPLQRQMLLTNDEAIVRLHGTSSFEGRSACTQTNQRDGTLTSWSSAERILSPGRTQATGKLKRCHSLKLLRGRDKEKISRTNSFKASRASPVPMREVKSDAENVDPNKKEKSSMFSKLFRRGRGNKKSTPTCASISSQFPPRDRSDPDFVFYNSRATQTLDSDERLPPKYTKSRSSSLSRVTAKERHSHFLTSTPATPKNSRRNNSNHYHQPTDIYHYRSSSVPRKSSPSPKREASCNSSNHYASCPRKPSSPKPPTRQRQFLPPSPDSRLPTGNFSKNRPKYESVFSPINKSEDLLLRAGDKYGEAHNSNAWPWRPTSVASMSSRPTSSLLPRSYQNGSVSWRQCPTSTTEPKVAIGSPMKPQPVVGLPRRVFPREETIKPPAATAIAIAKPQVTKTFTENIVTTDSTTRKGLFHLDGTVDVEISMGPSEQRQPGLPGNEGTDRSKKDLLKIAASWNQSVTNKPTISNAMKTSQKNAQTVSTTASITTTVTREGLKDPQKTKTLEVACPSVSRCDNNEPLKTLKSTTVVDCSGKCTITSELQNSKMTSQCDDVPSRTKMMGDKRDFFSESPSPLEPNSTKDDSGFSSSASTSRPMSVSPC